MIRRENGKLIDSNKNKESNLENRVVVDCGESSRCRDTIEIDGLESAEYRRNVHHKFVGEKAK